MGVSVRCALGHDPIRIMITSLCLSVIFSENRYPLYANAALRVRILLWSSFRASPRRAVIDQRRCAPVAAGQYSTIGASGAITGVQIFRNDAASFQCLPHFGSVVRSNPRREILMVFLPDVSISIRWIGYLIYPRARRSFQDGSSSRSSLLFEHDLFGKTGIHFALTRPSAVCIICSSDLG